MTYLDRRAKAKEVNANKRDTESMTYLGSGRAKAKQSSTNKRNTGSLTYVEEETAKAKAKAIHSFQEPPRPQPLSLLSAPLCQCHQRCQRPLTEH